MLELNLLAPYDLARRCALAMRDTGGGSIVNITSMSAIVATASTGVPSAGYCAAKAGLAHLTRELASQWGRHNIRVNAVAPGHVSHRDDRSRRGAAGVLPAAPGCCRAPASRPRSSRPCSTCYRMPPATSPGSRSLSMAGAPSPDGRRHSRSAGRSAALPGECRQGLVEAVPEELAGREAYCRSAVTVIVSGSAVASDDRQQAGAVEHRTEIRKRRRPAPQRGKSGDGDPGTFVTGRLKMRWRRATDAIRCCCRCARPISRPGSKSPISVSVRAPSACLRSLERPACCRRDPQPLDVVCDIGGHRHDHRGDVVTLPPDGRLLLGAK